MQRGKLGPIGKDTIALYAITTPRGEPGPASHFTLSQVEAVHLLSPIFCRSAERPLRTLARGFPISQKGRSLTSLDNVHIRLIADTERALCREGTHVLNAYKR